MTKTALYRYFSEAGQLLYVGVTSDPIARNASHAVNSDWHSQSVTRQIEWLGTREHALALEKVAIKFEHPLFNLAASITPAIEKTGAALDEAAAAMEAHSEAFGLELTTIGQMAVQNRNAYQRINRGTARKATAQAIMDWIERDRAARAEATQ